MRPLESHRESASASASMRYNPASEGLYMRWSSALVSIIVCAGVLCFLGLLRFLSRRGQQREDEEMRRHVRRNYPDAL
jgi:hypothetical protein